MGCILPCLSGINTQKEKFKEMEEKKRRSVGKRTRRYELPVTGRSGVMSVSGGGVSHGVVVDHHGRYLELVGAGWTAVDAMAELGISGRDGEAVMNSALAVKKMQNDGMALCVEGEGLRVIRESLGSGNSVERLAAAKIGVDRGSRVRIREEVGEAGATEEELVLYAGKLYDSIGDRVIFGNVLKELHGEKNGGILYRLWEKEQGVSEGDSG